MILLDTNVVSEAIAARWGCEVASRDVSPYRTVGLAVVDPWTLPTEGG